MLKSGQEKKEKQYKIKKVGPYLLLKEIGSGASATVFKAKIEKTYQKVAVKQIELKKLNQKSLQRVQQEFDILYQIRHDNIVQIIDFKKSENHRYLVFEYCPYGDLDNYIKKYFKEGRMPERKVQQVIEQLSSALKLMQSLKIVHRDLKLANILVGEGFVVKIADFGFAKLMEDNTLLKSTLGTPITMGPEILEGKRYNEKCDIWSLGVIIYQMLYGKPPFFPRQNTGIIGLKQVIEKGIIEFDGVPISDQLKNLIRRMLVKNPNERIGFKEFFENEWVTGKFQVYDLNETELHMSLKEAKESQGSNTKPKLKYIDDFQNMKEQSKQDNNMFLRKPSLEIILSLKIQYELRKYLETNVVRFLAGYNLIKKYFEVSPPSTDASTDPSPDQQQIGLNHIYDNPQIREIIGIASLLLGQRIQQFLGTPIMLEYNNSQLLIQNFKMFQGQFLVNGQNDVANIALILQKKLNDLTNFSKSVPFQNLNESVQYQFLSKILQYLMSIQKINASCQTSTNANKEQQQESAKKHEEQYQILSQTQLQKCQIQQQLSELLKITLIYQKNVLPTNSLKITIESKLLQNQDIIRQFNGLARGRFQKYSMLLRNLRFYEEYKKYEDFFDINVEQQLETLDPRAIQMEQIYQDLVQNLNSFLSS